jgi:nitrogen PTS system EIIA component
VTPIAQLLSPEDIRLDVEVSTKGQLLEEIGQHMERQHGLHQDWVVRSLARREQVGSTGVGEGVAIPHARVRDLHRILAAYLRLRTPIPFGSPDGEPVIHIIVLLVPKQATEEHLEILAAASRMFSDRRFRTQLEACKDAGQVSGLVGSWSETA